MNDNRYQLTNEEERTLAELHESKFFAALIRLAEVLDGEAVIALKTKATPDSDLRYWQGYTGGIAMIPLKIADLANEIKKQSHD